MKVGFIGLGIMGESMCENIVKKHPDTVYCNDLCRDQVKKLEHAGAVPCTSNLEVALKSDLIITMVPKSEHVEAVCREILPALKEGKIWIDMSTIDPSVSIMISERVRETGAQFADAPVVKSKPAAISGTLGIYVGCEEALYEQILPVLSYMGNHIIRMGKNGSGLVMKICHNTLVSEIQNGVNETLNLAGHYGISMADFSEAVSYGGGQNFYLDGQWQKLSAEDWTTAFSIENMQKDLGICEKMSQESNIDMPGMKQAKRVYDQCVENGIAKEDFRATLKAVRGDFSQDIK